MTQGLSEHNTPATFEGTPVDVPTLSLFAIINNATADVAAMLRMITSSRAECPSVASLPRNCSWVRTGRWRRWPALS